MLVGQPARLGAQLQQLGESLVLEPLDLALAERRRAQHFAEQRERLAAARSVSVVIVTAATSQSACASIDAPRRSKRSVSAAPSLDGRALEQQLRRELRETFAAGGSHTAPASTSAVTVTSGSFATGATTSRNPFGSARSLEARKVIRPRRARAPAAESLGRVRTYRSCAPPIRRRPRARPMSRAPRSLLARHVEQAGAIVFAESLADECIHLGGGHGVVPLDLLVHELGIPEIRREHRQPVGAIAR